MNWNTGDLIVYGAVVLLMVGIYPGAVADQINTTSPPPEGEISNVAGAGSVGYIALFLVLVSCFILVYCHRKSHSSVSDEQDLINRDDKSGVESPFKGAAVPITVDDNSDYSKMSGNSTSSTKFIFFDEGKTEPFELYDLLRASAETLGESSFGNLYKVVIQDGTALAVKRLKDLTASSMEFQQRMTQIGRLKHPNVLPLLAYCSSKDENLFVYEYQRNGSLSSLLDKHFSGPKPRPSGFGWNVRLAIAGGIAKGLAYLHQEFESQDVPHGNLKPSNVLLDENSQACIAEYGFASLLCARNTPIFQLNRLNGYKAPDRRITQKADVYSFGMILLELLTGKRVDNSGFNLPRWVQSVVREEWTVEVFDRELRVGKCQKKLVALLQMALNCVSYTAESRPKMKDVVHSIDKLWVEEECCDSFTSESSLDSNSQNSIPVSAAE